MDAMQTQDNIEFTAYIAAKFKVQPKFLLCYPPGSQCFNYINVPHLGPEYCFLFLSVLPPFIP